MALVDGLQDHAKVATNCCWTLINLVEQLCTDYYEKDSTVMSPYYSTIIPILIQTSARNDNEYNARASAYEALSTLSLIVPKILCQLCKTLLLKCWED